MVINKNTEWSNWFDKFKSKRYSNLDISIIEETTYNGVLSTIKKLKSNSIYDLIIVIPDHGIQRNNKKYLKPSFQWESEHDNINVTELYLELVKRGQHIHTLTCYFGNYSDSIKSNIKNLKHNCYISGFNSHIGSESYIDKWILQGCSPYNIPSEFHQKQYKYVLLEKTN